MFESVTTDADYLAAIDYSDATQQVIYESEAKAIDRIQKDILAIVKNEKPFDVFICYKETDEDGKRTVDSAIAKDIPAEVLEKYNNKRKEKIFPIVGEMVGNRCPFCSMEPPLAARNKLTGGGSIECDNCHRIIFSE